FAVAAAVMGRDGTATILYSSEDPGHDAKPSVPLAVSRAPGGAWEAASGWSPPVAPPERIVDGPDGVRAAIGAAPDDSSALVLDRRGAWSAPVPIPGVGHAVLNRRGQALLTWATPAGRRAAVVDPDSGLGAVGNAGPVNRSSPQPGVGDPPDMALNDAGDAVVAWARREGRGAGRVLEAVVH